MNTEEKADALELLVVNAGLSGSLTDIYGFLEAFERDELHGGQGNADAFLMGYRERMRDQRVASHFTRQQGRAR